MRLENYVYGFNGKERDDEGLGGGGSTYDYGFRIYNPHIAKFLSVDPLAPDYPYYTPFSFAGNSPVWFIDLDGCEQAWQSQEYGIIVPASDQFNTNPPSDAILRGTVTKQSQESIDNRVEAEWSMFSIAFGFTPLGVFTDAVDVVRASADGDVGGVLIAGFFFIPGSDIFKVAKLKKAENVIEATQDISDASQDLKKIENVSGGGAYGRLPSKEGMQKNHLPSRDAYKKAGIDISRYRGSAAYMEITDHLRFITTGNSRVSKTFRSKEAALLKNGKYIEAFDLNVAEIQKAFGNKYDKEIKQAREYFIEEVIPFINKQKK